MKYVDLTTEEEHSLLLQLDQYSIADIGFKDDKSLEDIIEEYKELFIESYYNSYYDFLIMVLEDEFNNLLFKDVLS